MMQEKLQSFHERFDNIMQAPKRIRNKRLVTLMEDMERTYNIPLLYSAAYTFNNPEVMKLYRQVSYARDFEGGR
ncbi:hypothetical protein J32TS6_05310 [Virgibacillus pantothenticus]|uniref:hypothetical protein n=1 Tax=Virgibacillus pantothenticus TaxID=1473 RepID=UPI001B126A91|nr:hypothetical protein [Virgibacillus pantothenticus]GIP61976.1 hypothetical protein J32TS6_05310 [Virgibacillus pantothenticus]